MDEGLPELLERHGLEPLQTLRPSTLRHEHLVLRGDGWLQKYIPECGLWGADKRLDETPRDWLHISAMRGSLGGCPSVTNMLSSPRETRQLVTDGQPAQGPWKCVDRAPLWVLVSMSLSRPWSHLCGVYFGDQPSPFTPGP